MKTIRSNRLASAAVVALLAVPGLALAQSAQLPAPQAATPPPPAAASPLAGHPVPGKNAEERVERRIKELHAQLRITSAEQPQWDQFAQVMRQNARDIDQAVLQHAQQFETMSAVQNMQSYEQLAVKHAQACAKLVPALRALYDAMPDQQKQLADRVFRANSERPAQGAHQGRNE